MLVISLLQEMEAFSDRHRGAQMSTPKAMMHNAHLRAGRPPAAPAHVDRIDLCPEDERQRISLSCTMKPGNSDRAKTQPDLLRSNLPDLPEAPGRSLKPQTDQLVIDKLLPEIRAETTIAGYRLVPALLVTAAHCRDRHADQLPQHRCSTAGHPDQPVPRAQGAYQRETTAAVKSA
jgi:hypothetical protein